MCLSVKSHLTYGASVRPENVGVYPDIIQDIPGSPSAIQGFKGHTLKLCAERESLGTRLDMQYAPRVCTLVLFIGSVCVCLSVC